MRLVLDIKQHGYKFYLKCVLNFACVKTIQNRIGFEKWYWKIIF